MGKASVSSKAPILLLVIHCFMLLQLFVGVLCCFLFCCAFLSVLSSFDEEELAAFLFAFLMFCD